MILIRKENDEMKVSLDTYKSMYKRLGYEIVEENKKAEIVETVEEPTVPTVEVEPEKVENKKEKRHSKKK